MAKRHQEAVVEEKNLKTVKFTWRDRIPTIPFENMQNFFIFTNRICEIPLSYGLIKFSLSLELYNAYTIRLFVTLIEGAKFLTNKVDIDFKFQIHK